MTTNAFRFVAPLPGSQVIGSVTNTWMEQVLDKSPLGILQMDLNGHIQYANQRAMAILGAQKCVDMPIFEFARNASDAQFMKERLSKRKQGDPEDYEVVLRRMDNHREIAVRVAAMPVTDAQGETIGSFSILRSLSLETL